MNGNGSRQRIYKTKWRNRTGPGRRWSSTAIISLLWYTFEELEEKEFQVLGAAMLKPRALNKRKQEQIDNFDNLIGRVE